MTINFERVELDHVKTDNKKNNEKFNLTQHNLFQSFRSRTSSLCPFLLYTENFVIVIYTEDEVESYFESSEINYVESS